MAAKQTYFKGPKSPFTGTLIGLAILVACQNLDKAASQLSPLLSCASGHLFGTAPTVALTVSRALSMLCCDNPSVLRYLGGVLASNWPLLCAMIGGA